MSSIRHLLRVLADARPRRLDPGSDARRMDAAAIMADPGPSTDAARATRPVRRLVLAGVVPAAAIVAVAVALTTVDAGAPAPGGDEVRPIGSGPAGDASGPADGAAPRTARELLLIAAHRSASSPVAEGRYWVVKVEHGATSTVGPARRPYDVMTRTSYERWRATSATDESRGFRQDLGSAPATAADEAAWKRDGSPVEWTQRAPTTGKRIVIKAAGGPRYATDLLDVASGKSFKLAGHDLSASELSALPSDPAALRARLLKMFTETGRVPDDEVLFFSATSIVLGLPVSAQVRAAAYRMLADIKGVTLLGTVTDRLGRAGMAVAYTKRDGAGSYQTRLIIQPRTGQALAQEFRHLKPGAPTAGKLLEYIVVESMGWSTQTPPRGVPPAPQQR